MFFRKPGVYVGGGAGRFGRPRRPKMAPKTAQDGATTVQDGAKMGRVCTKMPQYDARMLQDCAKTE